ncbi:MAG: hypothetical protein EOP49_00250 [Sphingobacteriales bacterium]|nr:MAG: hypothetical protein EOP49_00250 [Sphingobacteriales bacterium]
MFRNKNKIGLALTVAALIGAVGNVHARPNINSAPKPGNKQALLKTAAGCDPATSSIDLDINNVRAKLMTGGDMWWDIGTGEARYEVPKGSKKNSLFAGSVWIGGFTTDRQLKVAAQTYRQDGNDYWPGPLNDNNGAFSVDAATCSDWDRFWKVDKVTINKFIEASKNGGNTATAEFQSIIEWPANGNGAGTVQNANPFQNKAKGTSGNVLAMDNREYAPFVDLNGNGIYNPETGEYPDIFGDQYIWWVFNDKGNVKQQSNTEAIGVEVQASAFGFATKDFLNDATFYNYRLLNRSNTELDSTYIATWTDADLGYYKDDFIGCDTVRGLGILYNGKALDGNGEVSAYGNKVPMVGVDFFKGPQKTFTIPGTNIEDTVTLKMESFTYYNNNFDTRIGNPSNGVQIYNYMTGSSRNGQVFSNDFQGPGVPTTALGQGPATRFVFYGDPEKGEWAECVTTNPPDDRRFIHSSGPFKLRPGAKNDITIGVVWVADVGGCPGVSFRKIRVADDQAQALFDNGFKTIEGPEAPLLKYRELDRKLVFYLTNPPTSNNYMEKYGYGIDSQKYRVSALKARNLGFADSLYKFEGYRVFQLKDASVQAAQIFDERGELNTELASEVFQADITNGITQLVNRTKDIKINNCNNCYDDVIKVEGRDSGIVHSFVVEQDAFAEGQDKRLVNYRTYYFVAIAYAQNNFKQFHPDSAELTQDIVYLESSKGPGGSTLQVVGAMPNPGYQSGVGTMVQSDYGDGVIIKKLEGVGNGGNDLQLDSTSEMEALVQANGYQSKQPVYNAGRGPVDIKVIDPVKVPAANWTLLITPDSSKPGPYTEPVNSNDQTIRLRADKARWTLINETANETIYSEKNLDMLNEQILEQYGISLSIRQALRPGDDQKVQNGYITSDVNFANPAMAWLGGVPDAEQRSPLNWIRSGNNNDPADPAEGVLCNYSDNKYDTTGQFYENMLANSTFTRATWAPYALGSLDRDPACGFGTVFAGTARALYDLQSVDVVFTNDKSKWSRAVVLEMNDEASLTQGRTAKFKLRSHKSWNMDLDGNGNPIYSTVANDTGFSYFPGYAINQETGERLNIVFSEDSYQANNNGTDMIWNPTGTIVDDFGNYVFGGKHYVYISKTKYDGCDSIAKLMQAVSTFSQQAAYRSFIWTGMPTIAPGFSLLPLRDGLIPTDTRLRFRVTRPYGQYAPAGVAVTNNGFPKYSFNTANIAPVAYNEAGNTDANPYLDRIHAVPNPYYAYNEYESNRLDTRVRIVGLPAKATISVYSLDGSLIRRLTKDNVAEAFIDWDVRNAKGLPIASGMYLIHVDAEGLGEKIIRWFGAMRPVDITTY